MIYYLYKATNIINNKKYIGITYNPMKRFREHLYDSSNCTKLKAAIRKHGKDSFVFEVLAIGEFKYISELESKAIALFDSINNGYNVMLSNKVRVHNGDSIQRPKRGSDEDIMKRSNSMIGKNSGANNGMYGKKNYSRHRKVFVEGVIYESLSDAVKKNQDTLNLN